MQLADGYDLARRSGLYDVLRLGLSDLDPPRFVASLFFFFLGCEMVEADHGTRRGWFPLMVMTMNSMAGVGRDRKQDPRRTRHPGLDARTTSPARTAQAGGCRADLYRHVRILVGSDYRRVVQCVARVAATKGNNMAEARYRAVRLNDAGDATRISDTVDQSNMIDMTIRPSLRLT